MRLRSLDYGQHEGTPHEWIVKDLSLKNINLIVGKNAVGKTRTLNVIAGLAKLISGKQKLVYATGNYNATFEHKDALLRYLLHYEDKKIVREAFFWNDVCRLERGPGGEGIIFHEKEGKDQEFQAPEDELAAAVRQDTLQHKFLQPLYEWANSLRHYAFGDAMGRNTVLLITDKPSSDEPSDNDQVIKLFTKGIKEHPNAFKPAILIGMQNIGYSLKDIGVTEPKMVTIHTPFPVSPILLYVQESDRQAPTEQNEISQGMFRALAIIIHITYAVLSKKSACILIDDIGEGLDFDRSLALINLLTDKVKRHDIQLIMTTNDQFVMNHIPLNDWSVLQRRGGKVTVRNSENSKDVFEEFKFVGLSNFAFFEMDFATKPPKVMEAGHE